MMATWLAGDGCSSCVQGRVHTRLTQSLLLEHLA